MNATSAQAFLIAKQKQAKMQTQCKNPFLKLQPRPTLWPSSLISSRPMSLCPLKEQIADDSANTFHSICLLYSQLPIHSFAFLIVHRNVAVFPQSIFFSSFIVQCRRRNLHLDATDTLPTALKLCTLAISHHCPYYLKARPGGVCGHSAACIVH